MLSNLERTIACYALAGLILAGFAVPGLSEIFAPHAFLALFIMILLSLLPMARLDFGDIFTMDWNIWKIVLWQLFVLPLLIVSAATLLKVSNTITALMVVTSSAGSLFASPTFADLLKLNKQKALQCMILSTFMMPMSYFFFFTIILHAEAHLEFWTFIHRCTTFLVLPVGVFLIYMAFARTFPLQIAESIENVSRRATLLTLVVFGLGIVGPARDLLWANPKSFAAYLAIVTVLGAGMALLTGIVMFKQGITDALTASIVSGFRNVGLGFALLPALMETEAATYVGISQIPIFLAPLVINYLVRSRRETEDFAGDAAVA
jgi:bile acid:Na+ symporter, BASS family